jgi:hypothetical protein
MNSRDRLILGLFFSCLMLAMQPAMYALGGKEKDSTVRVTGTVRLVGSSPVSEVVITGQDGQWYIAKEDERKLTDLQYRTVTVEGIETVEELTFANGRSAGKKRTLSKIKIIAIQ